MMRWVILAAVFGAVIVPGVSARDAGRATDRAGDNAAVEPAEQELDRFLDEPGEAGEGGAELAAVEEQIEALERQRAELEIRADRLREFAEMQGRAREMLADANARLAELAAEAEEAELPPRRREMLAVMADHAAGQAKVARQVIALEGPDALDKAYDLFFEWEAVQTKWRMIHEPKHLWAAEIAEMTEVAADRGNPPKALDLIEEAKELREQTLAAAEKLYELWLTRAQADRKLRDLRQDFGRVMREDRRPARAKEPPG